MPIPSEIPRRGEWTARTETPKRSVFGNYRPADGRASARVRSVDADPLPLPPGAPPTMELALARAFIHRFLAQAYQDPAPEGWRWLCDPATQASLQAACRTVGLPPPGAFAAENFESFHDGYLAAFGHAARGPCPLNEIEYGEFKADPLAQPHRLADLAAFYRAFGMELAGAGERHDHLGLELEFMCVLAAKEAYARAHQLGNEPLGLCVDAQRQFLREHPGRWVPAFARRLAAMTAEPALRSLAEFTRAFIQAECRRFGVEDGGENLGLRPADAAAESLCAECGLASSPPGATPPA